jgi:hypothetical protein
MAEPAKHNSILGVARSNTVNRRLQPRRAGMTAEEWFQSPSLRDGLDQMRKETHSSKKHNNEYVKESELGLV